jgi:ABC-type transport system involved in cytochrome c biogenesis permease subunit
MASPKSAESHKVFRIKHEQLLTTMGLEKRSGFRYSIDEFRGKIGELEKQARLAHGVPAEERSLYQAAVLELANSLRHYLLLQQSFATPPTKMTDVREEVDFVISAPQSIAELARMTNVPLAVPPQSAKEPWQPLAAVAVRNELQLMGKRRNAGSTQQLADQLVNQVADQMAKATGNQLNAGMRQNVASAVNMAISQVLGETQLNSQPNAAAQSWMAILRAYERGDAATFNAEVEKYQNMLNGVKLADFNHAKTRFESYFNHFSPFYWEMYLYAIAFFLAAFAWLGWSVPLNRAAFWLIAVTLVAHTLALAARIYISGRPPVTNLYSSAVFIGWGAVVFGLIFERIFKLGVGNVIASIAGGATLLIAHFLAGDGDTFKVLVAVLDTNFWLATHVVLITLGYATTFVAGLLGLIYVLLGVFTPALKPQVGKDLSRMIYGTLCFATFFSFVGTVLGGLWADDSWGRFWGWDPKENGALIIVLWNALVLHARWGGMAKDRGVAVLAVVGNIVTSWSWFGVNQLGAGLHSYGFTSGVALTLLLFVISQIVVIGLGCLPKMLWGSARSFAGQG